MKWREFFWRFLTKFRHDIGACKVSFEAAQGCAAVEHDGHFDPVVWRGPAPHQGIQRRERHTLLAQTKQPGSASYFIHLKNPY